MKGAMCMNMVETGRFLQSLRKERGMTQEQLAECLGVTAKTISRWETGVYLPPAEMLLALSELYGLTVNELLSAKRLSAEDYKSAAEENLCAAVSDSFTLGERMHFFKRKWQREHLAANLIIGIIIALSCIAGVIFRSAAVEVVCILCASAWLILRNNQMMTYVERRAFRPDEKK